RWSTAPVVGYCGTLCRFESHIPCDTSTDSSADEGDGVRHLVEQAKNGNVDAFSQLASASIANLYAVARLILRDTPRAEDAVQDALVEAWRSIRGLRDPDRFDAWMHRLLVRACHRQGRTQTRRDVVELRLVETDAPLLDDSAVSLANRD